MWIKYNEELINIDKITTIRKSVGLNSICLILLDGGREIKKIPFETIQELEDYYDFIEDELLGKSSIKVNNGKGHEK